MTRRAGLHAGLIAAVVVCAVAGRGALAPSSFPVQEAAAPVPAAVAPAAVASHPTAPLASPPSAGLVAPAPTGAVGAASIEPSQDPIRVALGLPDPASLTRIEDGVVAARAMASSRGAARAPGTAPNPTPTPGPSPTPTVAPSPTPVPKDFKIQTYRVQSGDTLLAIAQHFGITPETVLWANDISSADLLQIGQELKILPVSGVLHTVRKGETLGGIADAYVADRAKIVEVNIVANPDSLQEGQVLIIPGGMRRTTEITGLPSAPSPQELAAAAKYTVRPGDTLLSIADAFGVRASTIQVANGLMDPDMLRVGLVLSIPGAKQSAPAPAPAPKPAPAPAPPPPPPAGSVGDRIAAIAQQYVGYRYVWGGHSPSGFDCSGFTWFVYKQAGLSIPIHDLWGQLNSGPKIGRADLQPGDLVFWQNTYASGLSHAGIYLGGGRFINAETERAGVQIRSMNDPYWSARFFGASRPR